MPDGARKLAVDERYIREFSIINLLNSATQINELLDGLQKEVRGLFDAAEVTIYFVDREKNELYSLVKTGPQQTDIRLPFDKNSIAGYVAATGKTIALRDVYDPAEMAALDQDLKFDSSWDTNSGFRTRQVMATPICHRKERIGVIQVLNKNDGDRFTDDDVDRLEILADNLGPVIEKFKPAPLQQPGKEIPPQYLMLVENRFLAENTLRQAIASAKQQRQDLEKVLINDFKVNKNDLGKSMAQYYGIPFEDLSKTHYNPLDLIKGKNIEYFQRALWVPLATRDNILTVAINNPDDQAKMQDIRQVFRATSVKRLFALKEDIANFLAPFSAARATPVAVGKDKSVGDILDEMKDVNESDYAVEEEGDSADVNDSAVVLLVRKIIEDAYHQLASDIHIEPYGQDQDAVVRYRIDGRCQKVLTVPRGYIRPVVSRIKVLAKMDISERRKPQDGKIRFKTSKNKMVELRVAAIPTTGNNEDMVLRLLSSAEPIPLDKMMRRETYEQFIEIIQKPYGIILVVGPTGSGKTTTLHSALHYINTPERKIWTAEEPVEITQYGLRQVQVNQKAGLTFPIAMRSFLRSDPDVIMVGEMRDHETVKMGIEASLTGHLVLSTLHTNSAPETVTRLIDMGMDPYNFADALLGIIAQRLTRIFCPDCKEKYHPELHEYEHIKEIYGDYFDERVNIPYTDELTLYRAKGCNACNDVGYHGRIGLYELLLNNRAVKKQIIERSPADDLRETAVHSGMVTLMQYGIHNTFLGNTDLKQVMSVCSR